MPAKENVVCAGVLEAPSLFQEILGEAKGEPAGVQQHLWAPLVGEAGEGDGRVFDDQGTWRDRAPLRVFASGDAVSLVLGEYAGFDQRTLSRSSASRKRAEECEEFLLGLILNHPQYPPVMTKDPPSGVSEREPPRGHNGGGASIEVPRCWSRARSVAGSSARDTCACSLERRDPPRSPAAAIDDSTDRLAGEEESSE